MPKLFIGLPVYNGEKFIKEVIDSIRNQTFTDWIMLISDNCSEDNTEKICQKYCKIDPRIKYYRQSKNMGGAKSLEFLLNSANCEYFMWICHDDVYHHDFILSCINNLEKNPESQIAFCNMVNTDSYGRIINSNCLDFSRFTHKFKILNILYFLLEPECLGKCNPILGLYRLEFFKELWQILPFSFDWGIDNCFVLAALARTSLSIDKRVLFEKRIVRPTDKPDKIEKIIIKHPHTRGVCPLSEANVYFGNNLKALKNTKYYYIGVLIVTFRYITCFILKVPRLIKVLLS